MTQKFVMYSPLYRLEQEFQRQGLKLSRQTMANWILQASDAWLRPVYDALHRQLCQETVLHGDETTLQVLKEPGKSAVSKSYMCCTEPAGTQNTLLCCTTTGRTGKPETRRNFWRASQGISTRTGTRVPQAAGEHSCSGVLGACQAEV